LQIKKEGEKGGKGWKGGKRTKTGSFQIRLRKIQKSGGEKGANATQNQNFSSVTRSLTQKSLVSEREGVGELVRGR